MANQKSNDELSDELSALLYPASQVALELFERNELWHVFDAVRSMLGTLQSQVGVIEKERRNPGQAAREAENARQELAAEEAMAKSNPLPSTPDDEFEPHEYRCDSSVSLRPSNN